MSDGTRVRLIGIDTPEVAHPDFGNECYGPEAQDYAEGCCAPANCEDIGHAIRVVGADPHRLDADGDGRACEPFETGG